MNESENTATQNLWGTVKAVLRGRFIALQAYIKKQERSQINNLTLHIKQVTWTFWFPSAYKSYVYTHSSLLSMQ